MHGNVLLVPTVRIAAAVFLSQLGLPFDMKTITGTFQTVQWQYLFWHALDQRPACPVSAMVLPIARPAIKDPCVPSAWTNTFETALVCACRVTTTPM